MATKSDRPSTVNTGMVLTKSALPAHLRSVERRGEGFEDLPQNIFKPPRLLMMQSLSQRVVEGKAKLGDFASTIEGMVVDRPLRVMPVLALQSRRRVRSRAEGGGILCQALDGKTGRGDPGGDCAVCKYAAFTPTGGVPGCDHFINVLTITVPDMIPLALSFNRTKLRVASAWLSQANLLGGGGLPLYAAIYDVDSVLEKNNYGSFANFKVDFVEFAPEMLFNAAKEFFARQRGKSIVVDEDPEDHAAPAADPNL